MSLLVSLFKFYSQFQAASSVLAFARTSRPMVASFSQIPLSYTKWLRPVQETSEEELILGSANEHNVEEWAVEEERVEESVPEEEVEEEGYDYDGQIFD